MIHKLHWYLGYNSLALITEQERKHWLLKTDKKKTLIDPVTRDQYIGQIDNKGSDIIVESEKQEKVYGDLNSVSLTNHLEYIFSLEPSAFTYCCDVSGFCFARITSINYPTNTNVEDFSEDGTLTDDLPKTKHYRIRFEDCETVILPFAGSTSTDDVFATKWIRTKKAYVELLNEDTQTYSESIQIGMEDGTTTSMIATGNVYYYYPLASALQTLPLEYEGNGSYHTLGVTDNQFIGYPLFWFDANSTLLSQGPGILNAKFRSVNGTQLMCFGNEGTSDVYSAKVYVGVDGNQDATPEDGPTSESYFIVTISSGTFNHTNADFSKSLNFTVKIDDHDYFISTSHSVLTMHPNEEWEYVDEETYRIKMSVFDQNCMALGNNPLIPVLDIQYYSGTVQNVHITKDVGYTGIQMSSGNPYSDTYQYYPYLLNTWDGLPKWLNDMDENHIREFMAVYALHNTSNYDPLDPDSRQTAALLFDLGKNPDIQYDFYTECGSNMEVPMDAEYHGIPLSVIFLANVRRNFNTYTSTRQEKGLEAYQEAHPQESGETKSAYIVRMKLEWMRLTTTERESYMPKTYGETMIDSFLYSYPFTKYQSNTELVKNMNIVGEYTDPTTGTTTEFDIDNPIADEDIYVYECKKRLTYAYEYWSEYDGYGGNLYRSIDCKFGVIVQDSGDPELYPDSLLTCIDDQDRTICTIYSPSVYKDNKGIDASGRVRFFRLADFAPYQDLTIDDVPEQGYWHIVKTIYNSDRGAGTYEIDTGLQFDLYPLSEISDVGRVYYLSNDDAEYENNRTSKYPKPDRTVARICDIPTSIVQLTGISGIAPVSVVDPNYVRTDVNFSTEDKDRLYNKMGSHWVRPTITETLTFDEVMRKAFALFKLDHPQDENTSDAEYELQINQAWEDEETKATYFKKAIESYQKNFTIISMTAYDDAKKSGSVSYTRKGYVFENLSQLNSFDLSDKMYHQLLNLENRIDPNLVEAGEITTAGTGYQFGDVGYIYIGGFAFQYNVTDVTRSGGVKEFTISAMKVGSMDESTYDPISISNFDLNTDSDGMIISEYTKSYGTSPAIGNGTGFKCTLHLKDLMDYIPTYGDLFTDLFALVKLDDGLWLYLYDVDKEKWVSDTQLAEFQGGTSDQYHQTTYDAVTSMMLPRRISVMGILYEDRNLPVWLDTLSTPSFVHIIDTKSTPIEVDDIASTTNKLHEIDLCKFRSHSKLGAGNGVLRYNVEKRETETTIVNGETVTKPIEKITDNVWKVLKDNDVLQSDCYLAFKWTEPQNVTNTEFECLIIARGFNNLIAGDDWSLLPQNSLKYEKYTNSNANTTIVWDVPNVGPMMWVFDPTSTFHEKYHIDQERQSFYIERIQNDWADIDIYSDNRTETPSLFTKNTLGELILDYDIYTNSIYHDDEGTSDEHVYLDEDFKLILSRGTLKDEIDVLPTGNWTCVFPRVHGFIFENDETNTRHIPIQMQLIHSTSISTIDRIYNEETGYDESARTIIMEDRADTGIKFHAFNSETSTWDTIK